MCLIIMNLLDDSALSSYWLGTPSQKKIPQLSCSLAVIDLGPIVHQHDIHVTGLQCIQNYF